MLQKFKIILAAGLAAAVVITSIGVNSAEARTRRQNNAAAAAAVAGLIGTAAVLAASDNGGRRYYYDDRGRRHYRAYRGYRGGQAYDGGQRNFGRVGPGQNNVNLGNGTQYYQDRPGGAINATPLGNAAPDAR